MMDESIELVVSRPVAACSRCRQAKTKCDGNLPACSACVKAGKADQCSSKQDDEFARGRERSFVATLEAREERLQRKVNEARRLRGLPLIQSFPRTSVGSQQSPPATPPPILNHPPQDGFGRVDRSEIDELVSSFGVLAVNAASRDFHGFTDTMSYARLVLAASAREPVPREMASKLPPRSEAISIAKFYLDNMFRFMPIFEESHFWTAVQAVYQPGGQAASPMDHWLFRMVLAISLVSQSKKIKDSYYWSAISHVAAALKYSNHVLRPGSLNSIQSMLLLVEYARYDPAHFDDWTLIGATCRAMVDLGLHQDPPKGSGITKSRLRERRMVYHCIYVLDRSISIALDLAFSFSDASTNVQYPRLDGRSPRPLSSPEMQIWSQPVEALYHVFKVRRIQSEIYQETSQDGREPWQRPYDKIWPWWHKLYDCYSGFPSSANTPARSKILFDLELLTAHLFLLAPSPRVPRIAELAQSLIFEYSVQYIETVSEALKDEDAPTWLHAIDATRARKVGRIFIDVLTQYQGRLLQGTLPNIEDHLTHNALTPPPFPFQQRRDNPKRAVDFITGMTAVLNKYGSRFGIVGQRGWSETFQLQSRDVLHSLLQQQNMYAVNSPGSNHYGIPTPSQ